MVVKKNWELIFEKVYFKKYKELVSKLDEYKKLMIIISNTKYRVRFDYSTIKNFGNIYFCINVQVVDDENNIIYVPEDSKYYDDLGTLLASSSVVKIIPRTGKIVELDLDMDEITDDLNKIIDYIKSKYKI